MDFKYIYIYKAFLEFIFKYPEDTKLSSQSTIKASYKGTVSKILSDHSFKDGNGRFLRYSYNLVI